MTPKLKQSLLAFLLLAACGDDDIPEGSDGGVQVDAARDAAALDAAGLDAGGLDVEVPPDVPAVNCDAIVDQAEWTLCGSSASTCEGVFEDSAGCGAFCASVGLPCLRAYDDNEGMCTPNTSLPELGCGDTGHISDYCVCGGECVPACGERECGMDGCGGSCGTCEGGESCSAGTCEERSDELKAFPSAFGAGAYVTGGRGGRVVHVTTLADSGPGSFREALALDEPRTVVFDVAGVIQLDGILADIADDLTVAGQTAPAGGITIDGSRVYIYNVDNVIFRYIRFRGGIDADNDSLSATGNITNQVFDHCSFAFDNDETASWYTQGEEDTVENLTVQRCLFGEGSKGSIIGGGEGVTMGGISVLRNLFYNQSHRYPNVPNHDGDIEVINNVSWTAGSRLIRGEGDGRLNHIGNYNDYGTRAITDRRMNMYHYRSAAPPSIYTSGNRIVAINMNPPITSSLEELSADNRRMWRVFQPSEGFEIGDPLPAAYFTDVQHDLLGSPTAILSADEALVDVRENVGANARLSADGSVVENLDVLDSEWLGNVRSGTYVARANRSEYNVPAIDGGEPYADRDRDGMPDAWESSRGLDPDVDDSAADDDADGYTNLEEFLNQVDG